MSAFGGLYPSARFTATLQPLARLTTVSHVESAPLHLPLHWQSTLGEVAWFSISRMQLPFVAMAALAGGNVRVGLEDNLYAGPGELATNARLVEKARAILENMNVRVMSPQAVRDKLQLVKR